MSTWWWWCVGRLTDPTPRTNHASISQLLAEVQSKYEQKAAECEAFQRRFQISTNGMPPPPPLEEEATRK